MLDRDASTAPTTGPGWCCGDGGCGSPCTAAASGSTDGPRRSAARDTAGSASSTRRTTPDGRPIRATGCGRSRTATASPPPTRSRSAGRWRGSRTRSPRVWLPNVNRSLDAAGNLALYLKRVSCARRMYSRRWNTPYQATNTTALRTRTIAIHPTPNDDIVARRRRRQEPRRDRDERVQQVERQHVAGVTEQPTQQTPSGAAATRTAARTRHAGSATTPPADCGCRTVCLHRRDDLIRSVQTEPSEEALHDFFTGSRSILTSPL